jgi:hypothetical protein
MPASLPLSRQLRFTLSQSLVVTKGHHYTPYEFNCLDSQFDLHLMLSVSVPPAGSSVTSPAHNLAVKNFDETPSMSYRMPPCRTHLFYLYAILMSFFRVLNGCGRAEEDTGETPFITLPDRPEAFAGHTESAAGR